MDPASLAEKFGFPVLCVIACGWFIRWLVMDRIRALEGAVKSGLLREIAAQDYSRHAQEERIKAANNFATAMREMSERTTKALERNTAVSEKNQAVLIRLMDHLAGRPYTVDPAARPPSSAEIPNAQADTERVEKGRPRG